MIDLDVTALARARHNYTAGIYDRLELLMEFRAQTWRKHMWDQFGPER